ncbi:AraC family transcriptional regulator [Arcticibacterium luteifluviistationis]|uniref:AraC family transcriptional regulator n=1 Tax=Arcticibacterium luteifluviistationis TaxID=1784714 RepID=A0A2Z4GED6_9BACT|nr:AraC family transcriptional regulator [Arcticibacterium luteifluviistationis]AWV99679.1 AraC family transcriptional regulator [Arcticibacterium luteifluviistationis]
MLRVPSEIAANQFEALKIQELTFVAYRSDIYPSKNEVFFEENAVIYVIEGEKRFTNTESDVTVLKGDVIFIRRGYYLMSESIDESYKSLVFFIEDKLIKDFVDQNIELFPEEAKVSFDNSALLVLHSNEKFGKFAESVLPYFKTKTKYLNQFLKLKLHELLLHLMEFDNGDNLRSVLRLIYRGEKEDLGYLMQNYYLKPLTISELSKLSGRSLSGFKRDFQEQFGLSPAVWIRSKRLSRAAFLLKNSDKNVSEVAEEVGFESISHFIKLFKETYGKTPAKY